MFNNDGDSVRLLDFNKNLKDDFEYVKTEQEKTLGRTSFDSDDFCLQEPSKNSTNNPCINPTPTVTPTLALTTGRINPSPTKKFCKQKCQLLRVGKPDPYNICILTLTPYRLTFLAYQMN